MKLQVPVSISGQRLLGDVKCVIYTSLSSMQCIYLTEEKRLKIGVLLFVDWCVLLENKTSSSGIIEMSQSSQRKIFPTISFFVFMLHRTICCNLGVFLSHLLVIGLMDLYIFTLLWLAIYQLRDDSMAAYDLKDSLAVNIHTNNKWG